MLKSNINLHICIVSFVTFQAIFSLCYEPMIMMFKQLKLLQFFPVNGSRRFSSLTKRKVSVNVIINIKPFLKIYFDYCKTCAAVSQDANFLDVLA